MITAIIKDGNIAYTLPPDQFALKREYDPDGTLVSEHYVYTGTPVYIHDGTYKLTPEGGGYRWKTKAGDWKVYSADGRLLSFGDRRGVTAAVVYDADGKLRGYADRHGVQVVWVRYDAAGRIGMLCDTADCAATGQAATYTYDPNGYLWKVTDTDGKETSYEHTSGGQLQKITRPDGQETHLIVNQTGMVAAVLDQDGQGYEFDYDYDERKKEYYAAIRSVPSGQVKEVWYDEAGRTKRVDIDGETVQTIEQDPEANALIITDHDGNVTRKEYDEWDNLVKVIHPDGAEDIYEYEHVYQQLTRKVEGGVESTYEYTGEGYLRKLVDAKGTERERITEYEYYTEGRRKQMRLTEAAGTLWELITVEEYDPDGNRTRLTEAAGADLERITEYAYTDGNLTRITKYLDGSLTAVTEMQYNADGDLVWQRDPSGQETTYAYEDDKLKTVTTAQGTWTYTYDTEERVWKVSDPFGNVTEREYADGNLKTVKVNGQVVATYTYTNGHLTQRTDALGNPSTFEYNADGQLTRQRDPENREQRYEYDPQGRLWKTIDGNNNEIVREYGISGTTGSGSTCPSCSETPLLGGVGVGERLLRISYPTFTKAFRYDNDGRVRAEIYTLTAGETYSVTYTYDPFGRLETTTGPDNRTTIYHYDRLGRRVQVDDPSGSTKFEYDRWDNLVALIDAEHQHTEFEYYPDGKLWKERRPLGQETAYQYDAYGRLWKILDAKQQLTEYEYDTQSRLWKIHAYADSKTVTLSYDPDGNLSGYDDGVTSASYTYDPVGRKLSETVNYGTFSKSFSYTYYTNGLKETFTAPDNTVYEYTYGDNNEVQNIRIPGVGSITLPAYRWTRPTTIVYPGGSRRELTYDPLMRLQRLIAKDPGGNALMDYEYTYNNVGNITVKETEHGNYGYDPASRLTSADNPGFADEIYTYDNVGNRTTASNATGSIFHNENNELLWYGDLEYTYDANGNMTQKRMGTVAVNYIYNPENRLIKVEDDLTKTVIAEYYYDPFGRRLWKDVDGVRTYFFYSDEGLIAEYDANGNEIKSYGYAPDSTWTTNPLWLKEGGAYYWYQNDHLGTPQKLVAQHGAVVWSATYEAFGNAQIGVETVVNNLRFSGQYFDTETGLHYNCYRYYDPGIGRYVSTDPIGFRGGVNLFTYTVNNPGNITDPIGLFVHPQHIIPPDEAVNLVTQVMATPLMYNLERDGIMERLDYAGNYALNPGGWGEAHPDWYNRFVFTCRYGWLDLGHFFQSAYFAYGIASGIGQNTYLLDPILYQLGEWSQKVRKDKLGGTYQSNFTPEDLPSNWLGWQWGRGVAFRQRVAPFLPMDFAEDFETMLKQSGAVVFTKDDAVNQYLKADVVRWWNHGHYIEPQKIYGEMPGALYTGERLPWPEVKYKSQAYWRYCCLCRPAQSDNPNWDESSSDSGKSSCGDWPVTPWTGYTGKRQQ